MQGLLGIFVLLSLVYKRHRETPKRPWAIWYVSYFVFPVNFAQARLCRLFDVSKQVVGQMFIHSANLLVSGMASHRASRNACVSYFLNILIDTTIGESYNQRLILILISTRCCTHIYHSTYTHSAVYRTF